MSKVTVDFSKKIGEIKPLHGVGAGPVTGNFTYDATEFFKEACIPFSRLHDIEYPFGSGEYVDIHCIFPNFDADVNSPDSYNFTFTDEYLKNIINAGTKVFYRLGTTIEHQPIKRYIHPPKDNSKWAKICEHIISHYNHGWADGFHMNIEYWEIWNEPDLSGRCWTGTDLQMFELYETAAKHLKSKFPYIKIGGCAFTSPYAPMAEEFLKYITSKEHKTPIDFFSWHSYIHTPAQAEAFSKKAHELLEKYGLDKTESIYDEWNYVVEWGDTINKSIKLHKTAKCAAFVSSVLTALQNSHTDKAMYYNSEVRMRNWNGLFSPCPMTTHGEKIKLSAEKPFYALKAFGELYKLKNQAECTCNAENVYALAANEGGRCGILISCYNDDEPFSDKKTADSVFSLNIKGADYTNTKCYLTDDDHTFELADIDFENISLKNGAFLLVCLS